MVFICGLSPGAKERLKEIADEEESDTTPNKSKKKKDDNKKSDPDVNIQKPKSPPSKPLNPPALPSNPPANHKDNNAMPVNKKDYREKKDVYQDYIKQSAVQAPEQIYITIHTFPQDAEVFYNNSKYPITLRTDCKISIDKNIKEKTKLIIKHTNYKAAVLEFKNSKNREFYVEFNNPRPFSFNSNPQKAIVEVDSKKTGVTPFSSYEIDPQLMHNISFNLGTYTKSILYLPGESKEYEVDLNYGSFIINLPEKDLKFTYAGVKYQSGSTVAALDDEVEIIVDSFGHEYTMQVIPIEKNVLKVINLDVPKKEFAAELYKVNNKIFTGNEIEIARYYEMEILFNTPCRARVELKNMDEGKTCVLASNWNITTGRNTLFCNIKMVKNLPIKPKQHYNILIMDEDNNKVMYDKKIRFTRNISSTPFGSLTGEPGLAFASDFEVNSTEDGYITGRTALLYSEEDDGIYSFGIGNYGYYIFPDIGSNMQLGISGNLLNIVVPGSEPAFKIDAKLVGSLQLFSIGREIYAGSTLHMRYSFGEEINPDDQPIKYSRLSSKPEFILSCGAGFGHLKFIGNISYEKRVALGISYALFSRYALGISVQRVHLSHDIPLAIELAFSPFHNLCIGPTLIYNFFRNDAGDIDNFYLLGFNFRYGIDF